MRTVGPDILLIGTAISTQYFTREDFLRPDFDWSQLVIEEHYFRDNKECSFVREEVTVFQYTQLSKEGKPINGTVTIAQGQEVDIRTFYDDREPDKTGMDTFTNIFSFCPLPSH